MLHLEENMLATSKEIWENMVDPNLTLHDSVENDPTIERNSFLEIDTPLIHLFFLTEP